MTDELLPARVRLLVLALLAVFLVAGALTRQPKDALASVVGIAIALPCAHLAGLSGRRRATGWLAVATVGVVLNAGGTHSAIGWFGVCMLALVAVPLAGVELGSLLAGALTAISVYKLLHHGFDVGWLPWCCGVAVSALGGAMLAHQRSLLEQLRAAQSDLAERSRTEERTRIARELHDIIAHSLTVSLLHIGAARLAVEHDPADAVRALAEAERLGRESLEEVRSIVGLMRRDGAAGDAGRFAPTPGLDAIPELVERFRNAGVAISFERDDEGASVPGTVGTSAYRIAQEALTNAAKHAPGATVSVRIHSEREWLALTVDSAGAPGGGRGNGLASMRERAEALGGRFAAAPVQLDGVTGWRVLAEFPTAGGSWRS